MTRLALINNQTMVCENVTSDDRPANEIVVPGFIVLDLDTTTSYDWNLDEQQNEYVMFEEGLGCGGIGYTWNGEYLLAKKPEVIVQPVTTGLQEL